MGEHLMTVEQVMDRLAVSRKWLYQRTYRGEIPHLKLGGLLRFRESDLRQWEAGQARGGAT